MGWVQLFFDVVFVVLLAALMGAVLGLRGEFDRLDGQYLGLRHWLRELTTGLESLRGRVTAIETVPDMARVREVAARDAPPADEAPPWDGS